MRRPIGMSIRAAVAALLPLSTMSHMDPAQGADFVGTRTCKLCHRIVTRGLLRGYENTGHSKAMQDPGDTKALIGDFGTNVYFRKEQVAFIVGKGYHQQAYLDQQMMVLPAVWDVRAKRWTPTARVDAVSRCLGCHTTGLDPGRREYAELAVGCKSCHGPGHKHLGRDGRIVNPAKLPFSKRAMVCGQCHAAGTDKSKALAFPVGFRPGDDLRRFFPTGRANCPRSGDQYTEHAQSRHSREGVTCITCHNPHAATRYGSQLRRPGNSICLSCHGRRRQQGRGKPCRLAYTDRCMACHMPGGRHIFAKPSRKSASGEPEASRPVR